MPLTQMLRHARCGMLAACGLLLGGIAPAQAQGLRVAAITIDGRPAQRVAGVQVRRPGAASSQAQTVRLGDPVAAGTELEPPRGAKLELTSSNNNSIFVYSGARFMAGIVTAKGETHQPLGGKIEFLVRNALDFYNMQYDHITASVHATEYSVEIDPAKSLKVTVVQGAVEVERRVQIKFTDTAVHAAESGAAAGTQSSGIRFAEELKAGQSKSYSLTIEEYLKEFSNFGDAEAYFRKAFADAGASGDRRQILRAVLNLMELYGKTGRPTATLEFEGRCIGLAQTLSNPAAEASCLTDAGIAYSMLGDYHKAIEYHSKSLAIKERLHPGRDHPGIAASLNNIGNAHKNLGDNLTAIKFHEQALAMRTRLYGGRDHPSIATSLNNLGNAYKARREYAAAIEYHQKALDMKRRVYAGREHPDIAVSLNNLGDTYEALGEHEKAIKYDQQALEMKMSVYAGRDHPSIAFSLNSLGNIYRSLRQYGKAIEYYRSSLEMRERIFAGRIHPDIVDSLKHLANAYEGAGKNSEAAQYRERAAAMEQRLKAG